MLGLIQNFKGKIVEFIINGYNLKMNKDIYIGFLELFINCYR